MDYYQIIAQRFQGTMENIAMSVDQLAGPIGEASELMSQALLQDRKIIACGNGVDAAQAQLFTASLLSCFENDRPALPALYLSGDSASLTAIASSDGLDEIHSRPLRALGQQGDLLLLINSAGPCDNLAMAMDAAHERNMAVVALSNNSDTSLPGLLQDSDALLQIETTGRSRVVEMQTMVLHTFCQLIEHSLFGDYHQE